MQYEKHSGIREVNGEKRFDIVGHDEGLSLDALINHIEFVNQITDAEDPEDLVKRLLKALNQMGFSDFALIGAPRDQKANFFLTSLPNELINCYQEKKYHQHDMVLDYLKTGISKHVHYSSLKKSLENAPFKTYTFTKNLEILALYKEYKFNDAYLMPITIDWEDRRKGAKDQKKPESGKNKIKQPKRDNMMFLVTAKGASEKQFQALTKDSGTAIHLLGDTAIRIHRSKFKSFIPPPIASPKALRLLTIMAKNDLTLVQAADRLCLSTHTINKHMAMAKKELGARTQANAIYRAIQRGLIDFN
ncbi:MAG: autoinducer binding domain-containing protein [Porticoccaceae bacterium]|nr:autoinducer binding domain-containing protein [Porticoccaceae bacterium]